MTAAFMVPFPLRDAVVYVAQASTTGPPWLAIVLAAVAALSAIGVALAPAFVERVKRSHNTSAVAVPASTPPPAVEGSVDLVREALDDARRERDEAQDEAKALARQLAAAQVEIARRDARIESLIDRLGRGPA